MSGVKHCPLCGDNGFVKASTRRKPSGEWDARMKCEECGIELVCSGATEDDALTAVLVKWNTRSERTCVLEDIPYEPGRWEGVRCSSCGVTDEDTDLTGNYCTNCGARIERGESCAT